MIKDVTKRPDFADDFGVDWRALGWLRDGENVVSATWTIEGDLAKGPEVVTADAAMIRLSGGIVGQSYSASAAMLTNQGRRDSATLRITVEA